MRGSKIRILRPDPKTGEVLEEIVPADHFKPKLPKRPKLRQSRVSPCSPGWACLHVLDLRERQVAYWEAHATSLTREEQADLANARTTSILRPIAPGWKKGDRLKVAANIEAEVIELTRTLRGYGTVFRVVDLREWLVKRAPSANSPPKTDRHGHAIAPTAGDIETARLDGAYTTSPTLAIPDAGAVMDDKLYRRIHGEAAAANAIKQTKQRVKLDKMRLEMRLAEARRKGWRSTIRYLERVQSHHEGKEAA